MRTMLLRLCCLAALPFIAVAVQTPPAQAEDTVKVGLIMTYTGQFTDAATQMDNGIKLYMKQHGDTVAGKKIEIIRKDDGGAPDNAKRSRKTSSSTTMSTSSPASSSRRKH